MNHLPNTGYPNTGEIAESGTYACMNRPHNKAEDDAIVILYKRETLPECPVCGTTCWMKIS